MISFSKTKELLVTPPSKPVCYSTFYSHQPWPEREHKINQIIIFTFQPQTLAYPPPDYMSVPTKVGNCHLDSCFNAQFSPPHYVVPHKINLLKQDYKTA